jgi:putative tricarboxylic transport membrane protein
VWRLDVPRLAAALGVVALGAVVLWQTLAIPVSPIYAKVGPTVIPFAVAAGLLLLGLVFAVQVSTGNQPADEAAGEPPVNWRSVAWLGAGLILNVVLIGPLGFVLASTLLFFCVARAFDSERPARDALIGFVVAAAAYLGFARLLGINIGAGLLEGLV